MDLLPTLHRDSAEAILKRLGTSKLTSIQYAAVSETCAKLYLKRRKSGFLCSGEEAF
jgi:hypothetical protein